MEGARQPSGLLARPETKGVMLYLAFAALWIVVSDRTALRFRQYAKALGFVSVTAFAFFRLLRSSFRKREQAVRLARDACERFELVARASNDAMWDWNLVTDEIWWSEGFEHMFGYTIEELEPTIESWTKRIHPEDQARTIDKIHEVINRGCKIWFDEYRFRRKDGSYAPVFDRGFVIHDEAGKPVRMVGGITDLTARRLVEQKLEATHRRMRALSARLQSLREEERTHLSRELHDKLGQLLTALKMDLRWAEKQLSDPDSADRRLNPVLDKLVEASGLADQTISCVQDIAADLRPGTLDSLGLAAAIRHEARRFQERTGVTCHVEVPESPLDLKEEVSTAMFRIFQEALANVARHSQATEVQINLRRQGEDLVLIVRDNGRGITTEDLDNPRSLGLLGMSERAALLNSGITFARAPEGGTVVTLRVPESTNDTKFWELV